MTVTAVAFDIVVVAEGVAVVEVVVVVIVVVMVFLVETAKNEEDVPQSSSFKFWTSKGGKIAKGIFLFSTQFRWG